VYVPVEVNEVAILSYLNLFVFRICTDMSRSSNSQTVAQQFPLDGVAHGTINMSFRRVPLSSVELSETLRQLVSLERAWSVEDLEKHKVAIAHFLGNAPWAPLPSNRTAAATDVNPALSRLEELIITGTLSLHSERTLLRVGRILFSQGVSFNADAPTRFLWLVNLPEGLVRVGRRAAAAVGERAGAPLVVTLPASVCDPLVDGADADGGDVDGRVDAEGWLAACWAELPPAVGKLKRLMVHAATRTGMAWFSSSAAATLALLWIHHQPAAQVQLTGTMRKFRLICSCVDRQSECGMMWECGRIRALNNRFRHGSLSFRLSSLALFLPLSSLLSLLPSLFSVRYNREYELDSATNVNWTPLSHSPVPVTLTLTSPLQLAPMFLLRLQLRLPCFARWWKLRVHFP
jgi:hypothetical protein